MEIQTLAYVKVSELFENFPTIKQFFDEGEYGFSWGDNNHSLIGVDTFMAAIDTLVIEDDSDEADEILAQFQEKVATIPKGVYINLEL